jgi:hypothetical protein
VRCGPVFLRDGGIQRAVLNAAIDGEFDEQVMADPEAIARDQQLNAILAAPIPLDQLGPYDHPWRAPAP